MRKTKNDSASAAERMKAYIAEHLQEPITGGDVAKAAGYSQYHAARVFKKVTGRTPFEYIRNERLIASAHALRASKAKVLDVALDFVFDSHEGFTRAFANAFGVSPKRYASMGFPECGRVILHYLNRSNTNSEDMDMDQTSVIFTQIMERPARKLILKRSKAAEDYFSYVAEVGCGAQNNSLPWDTLTQIEQALYEPVGLWLPGNLRPEETGVYAHGVEVPADYDGVIPTGFDVIDLPPCKLLVFQGEPYDEENFDKAVLGCMERIKVFNPEVYGYRYAPELAPKMQLSPQGWRGYIEMMPVEAAQ